MFLLFWCKLAILSVSLCCISCSFFYSILLSRGLCCSRPMGRPEIIFNRPQNKAYHWRSVQSCYTERVEQFLPPFQCAGLWLHPVPLHPLPHLQYHSHNQQSQNNPIWFTVQSRVWKATMACPDAEPSWATTFPVCERGVVGCKDPAVDPCLFPCSLSLCVATRTSVLPETLKMLVKGVIQSKYSIVMH